MKHLIGYYINHFKLWLHRKQYKWWWVGLHCTACGKNVFKHKGDYFHLKQEIWEKAVATPVTSTSMVLCKKCTERLLGRKLEPQDYADYEIIQEQKKQPKE